MCGLWGRGRRLMGSYARVPHWFWHLQWKPRLPWPCSRSWSWSWTALIGAEIINYRSPGTTEIESFEKLLPVSAARFQFNYSPPTPADAKQSAVVCGLRNCTFCILHSGFWPPCGWPSVSVCLAGNYIIYSAGSPFKVGIMGMKYFDCYFKSSLSNTTFSNFKGCYQNL